MVDLTKVIAQAIANRLLLSSACAKILLFTHAVMRSRTWQACINNDD